MNKLTDQVTTAIVSHALEQKLPLVKRNSLSVERKVVGGTVYGLLAAAIIGVINGWWPALGALLAPEMESFLIVAASTIGGYVTKSRALIVVAPDTP